MKEIKVGDVFINRRGAIVVVQEPTKSGNPQYNIAPSSEDYFKGFYECRGTMDYEGLDNILKANGYERINRR